MDNEHDLNVIIKLNTGHIAPVAELYMPVAPGFSSIAVGQDGVTYRTATLGPIGLWERADFIDLTYIRSGQHHECVFGPTAPPNSPALNRTKPVPSVVMPAPNGKLDYEQWAL